MARVYKCFECKWNVTADDAVLDDGKHYHPKCYALVLDRRNFVEYVCKLFGLKSPGPVIYSQRKNFMEKYGYTDAGMLKTLQYLYDIKKTKTTNAKERIGLIPFAYDEAQAYFEDEAKKKQEIAQKMVEAIEQQKIEIIKVHRIYSQKEKGPLIDPESLLLMKDEE